MCLLPEIGHSQARPQLIWTGLQDMPFFILISEESQPPDFIRSFNPR
jgi:hypothetical protein